MVLKIKRGVLKFRVEGKRLWTGRPVDEVVEEAFLLRSSLFSPRVWIVHRWHTVPVAIVHPEWVPRFYGWVEEEYTYRRLTDRLGILHSGLPHGLFHPERCPAPNTTHFCLLFLAIRVLVGVPEFAVVKVSLKLTIDVEIKCLAFSIFKCILVLEISGP